MIRDDGSSVDPETENRVKWIATSGFGGACSDFLLVFMVLEDIPYQPDLTL